MKTRSRYYRISVPVITAWTLGVFDMLLAVAITGTLPIAERLTMFLP